MQNHTYLFRGRGILRRRCEIAWCPRFPFRSIRDAAIAARTDHMSQPVRAHYGTDALTRHVVANTRQRLVKGDIDRGQGRTVEGSEGSGFKVVISRGGL